MSGRTDSGRFSLAGFLYQIIGSGAECCRLTRHEENDDDAGEILELEQLGQDLSALPTDGGVGRLIQFKYSSKNDEIKPNHLRKILEAFLASVTSAGKQIEEFTYELVSNRPLHKKIDEWKKAVADSDAEKLEQLIQESSATTIKELPKLSQIFTRLKLTDKTNTDLESDLKDAAARLGVLDNELDSSIDGVIGLLARKSTPAESPRIIPPEVRERLAGHNNAIELIGSRSIEMRIHEIETFQKREYRTSDYISYPIVPRTRLDDIANAVFNFPVVVVYGTGGCGKSIALSEVALGFLRDTANPPGFCFLNRANSFTTSRFSNAVSKWRSAGAKVDTDFRFALYRLQVAYVKQPIIVFFVDAIDEKIDERLSDSTTEFLSDLIEMAAESRRKSGVHQLAVILACRHEREANNIRRMGNEIAAPSDVKFIPMTDYSAEELLEAVTAFEKVSGQVAERIINFMGDSDLMTLGSPTEPRGDVDDQTIEVLKNPVFWFLFSELPVVTQLACLDGDSDALCQLGRDYIDWFKSKASSRIKLGLGICESAFYTAAKTFNKSTDRGDFEDNWIRPIVAKTKLSESDVELLYLEAASAGIIVTEDSNKSWRWRFPWFCQYLIDSGGIVK